jgi:hypothetical protein
MAKPLQAANSPALAAVPAEPAPVKRGPGRPPGAPNKKRGPGRPPAAAKAVSAAPRKARATKTQWAKWGQQLERITTTSKKLSTIAVLLGGDVLSNNILSDESLEEIAALVSALQKLDAERVEVPAIPKAPKAPLFAVGDKVKLSKKAATAYLESGIYTAADLDNLEIVAVGKKGILASSGISTANLQVFVRSGRQLEKR